MWRGAGTGESLAGRKTALKWLITCVNISQLRPLKWDEQDMCNIPHGWICLSRHQMHLWLFYLLVPWQAGFWIKKSRLWRRKWPPTPVFLPGEFLGQWSLVGCTPWVAKHWTWLSGQHHTQCVSTGLFPSLPCGPRLPLCHCAEHFTVSWFLSWKFEFAFF